MYVLEQAIRREQVPQGTQWLHSDRSYKDFQPPQLIPGVTSGHDAAEISGHQTERGHRDCHLDDPRPKQRIGVRLG